MDSNNKNGIFVSWLQFQRRTETVAKKFNMPVKYFHYNWEEKHVALKVLSYVFKSVETFAYLVKTRPKTIIVQLPPTPTLYVVSLYSLLFGAKYLSDCHNTMIYDAPWINWPLAKILLRRSSMVLVHNDEVKQKAKVIGVDSFICMDPPPIIEVKNEIDEVAGIKIKEQQYVLLPCNMAADDEPTEEFFEAARSLPEIQFVLTGFLEKVPEYKRKLAPSNVKYTGFLKEEQFNALYKHAQVAVVLSTREGTQPSGASEAIALEVPLVVTDMKITRKLYKNTVLYTKNKAQDLAKSIKEGLAKRNDLKESIVQTKEMIGSLTSEQYENLKYFINAIDEKEVSGTLNPTKTA
jgi:glycosyltransferase involved in cell wall biosynthesis